MKIKMTFRFCLTTIRIVKIIKHKEQPKLGRIWSEVNTSPLLGGVQTCTEDLEINKVASQKMRNRSTSSPHYTTSGNMPKRTLDQLFS